MKPGDVILTALIQADGKTKRRPALVLCQMPPYQDYLVCGISTQLRQEAPGFDELILPMDADFAGSGLKAPSLIRLGFLSVVPSSVILGSIGSIASERRHRLAERLSAHLLK